MLAIIGCATRHPEMHRIKRRKAVRFVSILSKASSFRASTPITLPPSGEWLVRLFGSKDRFVFGVYRRHMKTITYLGQVDKLFGVSATTRNWNTITSIVRILKGQPKVVRYGSAGEGSLTIGRKNHVFRKPPFLPEAIRSRGDIVSVPR
jgi:hypothetical protein